MKKEKLAMFDMDGTLFDTEQANYYAYQNVLMRFGYSMTQDYWKENFGKNYMDFLPAISESNVEFLKKVHELKKVEYKKCLGYIRENIHLFDVMNLIRKEYNIALITTASKENCYDVLNVFDRKECFDLILTQEEVKKLKPDPEGYLLGMKYFGISPEKTIIFEDSDVGMQAAIKTGATVFLINNF